MKLTPWFVNGEKPTRKGVYNVSCRKKNQTGLWFARWDGKTWHTAALSTGRAEKITQKASDPQRWNLDGSWRGLAEEPEK